MGKYLIMLLFLCVGCSRSPQDPAAQVRATLDGIEKAAEERDIDGVLAFLAPTYKDSRGRGPSTVRSMLQLHFLRQGSVHALVRVQTLQFPTPDQADVTLSVAVAGTGTAEQGPLEGLSADAVDVELTLVRDGSDWKIQRASWTHAGLFE